MLKPIKHMLPLFKEKQLIGVVAQVSYEISSLLSSYLSIISGKMEIVELFPDGIILVYI